MAFDIILWLLSFGISMGLLSILFYQVICLSDLESDQLNAYETASKINSIMIPEFALQGALTAIFLLTWHWFMFLISVPVTYYNVKLYRNHKHLIDVTEIFRQLNTEKKYRFVKLGYYMILLVIVIIRLPPAARSFYMLSAHNPEIEGLDIRSSFLEF
ncbi:Cornichon [Dillenia turbinata]|uniref:Cornichon n=1 Tax=Dillenia turbinata TaxID=194707 RepID=A0AAN8W9U3_9MAGN